MTGKLVYIHADDVCRCGFRTQELIKYKQINNKHMEAFKKYCHASEVSLADIQ